MTSVSGTMFGSWTLSYDDESRLTSVTYPGGTDSFSCNALGQKMRAVLGGTAYRYVYNGDRVMEETNDAGTVTTRYMTESGSYYSPLINQFRTGCRCRWPLEDGAGTVRGLAANIGGEMSDWYELDAFGVELSSSGASRNDYAATPIYWVCLQQCPLTIMASTDSGWALDPEREPPHQSRQHPPTKRETLSPTSGASRMTSR